MTKRGSHAPTDDLIGSSEMCEVTGATYRQLDYWARTGILQPELDGDGSGTKRFWRRSQVTQAQVLAMVSEATHGGSLLREIGHPDDSVGPWIMEHDNVRITVEVVLSEGALVEPAKRAR